MRWQMKKVGDIAQVISGFAFKSAAFTKSKGVPVIKIANIRPGYADFSDVFYVDKSFLTINPKYHVENDDILISLTGSHINLPNSVVGRVARYRHNFTALLNQRAGKFLVKENLVDKRFLFYALSQRKMLERIAGFAQGAANQANISPSNVESVDILLPDIRTQKRIADILSAYDDLIENNLRRIQLLEEAARAQFMRITKDVKETKPLSNFTSMVKRGISPKYVEKEGITVLNQKCIRTLSIDFSQSRLTDQSKKISPERMLQKFDTVVNSTGTGTLGRVSLHLHEDFPATVDSHVTIVRAREEVPRLFLAMAILIQQDVISMMGEGATNQTELSAKRLSEELTIPVISTNHMLEYHNVIVKQFDSIWNLQKQISLLKQARNILLPCLMTGEIDASSIEIPEIPITEPLEAV